jgi:hypothetical protein
MTTEITSVPALIDEISAFLGLLSEIESYAATPDGQANIDGTRYDVAEIQSETGKYRTAYAELKITAEQNPDSLPGDPAELGETLAGYHQAFYGVALDIGLKSCDDLVEQVTQRFDKMIGLQRQIVAFLQSPEGQAKMQTALHDDTDSLAEIGSDEDGLGALFGGLFAALVPSLAGILEKILSSAIEMLPQLEQGMESIRPRLTDGSLKPSELLAVRQQLDQQIAQAEEQIKAYCSPTTVVDGTAQA